MLSGAAVVFWKTVYLACSMLALRAFMSSSFFLILDMSTSTDTCRLEHGGTCGAKTTQITFMFAFSEFRLFRVSLSSMFWNKIYMLMAGGCITRHLKGDFKCNKKPDFKTQCDWLTFRMLVLIVTDILKSTLPGSLGRLPLRRFGSP